MIFFGLVYKMKINYQKMLDDKIEEIKKQNIKPSLLLHACCAPCSSAVLEYLYEHFNITLFFYNPNISPESEFNYRLEELKRLVAEMNFNNIEIVVPDYDNNEFEELAKGLENLPEGDKRCKKMYNYLTTQMQIAATKMH